MTDNELRHAIEKFALRTGYRPGNVNTALIDMDGTLYDSMPWHARAWHRMVSELGIESTVDEFFAYEGMTGKATVNLLFRRAFGRDATDAEVEELYAIKSRYFVENNRTTVMPGARDMVDTFRSNGVTPILVTGSGQAFLLERLEKDFDGAFGKEMRITSRDVKKGKPDPEPYLKGLEKRGVDPWQAIVVENTPLGIQSGVGAGIFTVGVKTGPIDKAIFAAAGADLVFDSMPRFAETLPRLLYILKQN